MFALLNDVRFGFRYLRLNFGYTITALVVVALGVALSVSLFAVVKGALLTPWPYDGYDRLVTFRGDFPEQSRSAFALWSAREVDALREHTEIFDHVIAGVAGNVNLSFQGHPERVRAARITPNAFGMLGVPAAYGRLLSDADAQPGATPVVVISHEFWTRRLNADPSVVGATLRIGAVAYEIVGVMPAQFRFWDRQMWMPLRLDPASPRDQRDLYVQARLQPGISVRDAEARLAVMTRSWAARFPEIGEYRSIAIRCTPLVDAVLRDLRPILRLLMYAVFGVLLAAASNVANAMLAKSIGREGELATRRALGATGPQMARQLFVESLMVSSAGGLLGGTLAAFLLPQILAQIPYGFIPAEARVELDGIMVALAIAIAMACGVFAATVPAWRAMIVDPAVLLRSSSSRTTSGRPHRLRAMLITAQLVMAVVVIGAALTMFRSTHQSLTRDPGYATEGIWTARIALPPTPPADRVAVYERLLRHLRETPALENAAMMSTLPVGDLPRTLVSTSPGAIASVSRYDADSVSVSSSMLQLLHVGIVDGRGFTDFDNGESERVAIISKGLADRIWPGDSAVGRQLFAGNDATPLRVVGVTRDIVANPAEARIHFTIFRPLLQAPPGEAVIALPADGPALEPLSRVVAEVDPSIPVFETTSLTTARAAIVGPQMLAVLLLALFGGTVLLLSTIGLYAVVSQSLLERVREFSIRLAFGAQPRQLFLRELARGARIISVSVIAGGVIAIAGMLLMNIAAPSVAALPVAAAAIAVTAAGVFASALPAYRASRGNLIS